MGVPVEDVGTKARRHEATEDDGTLGAYWRGVGICLGLLGIYLLIIWLFGTETWKRTTAPPWYAWWRFPPTRTRAQAVYLVLPAIVFAGWIGFVRRMMQRRIHPITVMAGAYAAVFAMNVTVAMIDGGPVAISKPFSWGGSEYFDDVRYVTGVKAFLGGYVQNMYHYSIHSRTHPPGPVLFLYFVKCLFGPGIQAAAWSAVVVTSSAVVPFYLLARCVAGERVATIGTGIYVVVPSLVLFGATSMDGVFLTSLMWSMYWMRRVMVKPGIGNSLAAGVALFVSFMLSYVAICVVLMMGIYAALELCGQRSIWRVAGLFVVTGFLVVLLLWVLYLSCGFNYIECFKASRHYDHYSMRTFTMSFGRYLDISFSNLVAFLIGMGLPVVALWWQEMKSASRFVLAETIAVLGFSFAKLFTHETERIWLFLAPVAILAAAGWITRLGKNQRRVMEWTLGMLFAQTWVFQILLYTIW
jgi:hypothetical protein